MSFTITVIVYHGRYHMKRCVDSGLWVPNKDDPTTNAEDGFVTKEDGDDEEEVYEEVKWCNIYHVEKTHTITKVTSRCDFMYFSILNFILPLYSPCYTEL